MRWLLLPLKDIMVLRYHNLIQNQPLFQALTGLGLTEFDELVGTILPCYTAAEKKRLNRPDRQRVVGGGPDFELEARDQILLTTVWLRQCPTLEALGCLFGISDTTAGRYIRRILPLVETAGLDTMRMPDPGRKRRRHLSDLLQETPELALIIDAFGQSA
ncbi:MAG: transposase family protein [Anaerolineales bacterium]|nr:transposase family protein [Anaerolineales bacterium]